MQGGSIGPLVGADEHFNHQIVETHASVLHTDPSWAEKVCGMVGARDGSLQIGFGFGKYVNRNVVDAYAGVSRGCEQWNVRASRALDIDLEGVSTGPIRYEIIAPLKKVRVRLEKNAVQPIAFDLLLEGVVPCFTEAREDRRSNNGFRRTADQIRYHQIGVASGWIEVNGERREVNHQDWVMTRDHSWGVRPGVGAPLSDMAPELMDSEGMRVLAVWNPLLFQAKDGSSYAFHQYLLRYAGPGFSHELMQGHFEYQDGRREAVRSNSPRLVFDPGNRRMLHGEFHLTLEDGSSRILTARAISDTGFHLGGGLYHGFDGQYVGQWCGRQHLDGEYFADCRTPESTTRLNQFRDCMIVVQDSATEATGWGNCQTWVHGEWPELAVVNTRNGKT
ncbi:hypothetical protein SAMN04515620_10481 [Collimonas sp. OK607]|uniref:hypothetical protein n=1 Tax=Collimonas sp. OK607 TaxID=1798194 RepID=UPI0008E13F14|nr:hypothetical protein [Collimonas sp. OK607]SFA82907.1 hypothetical protein SAMN04515620_10481 [Collimonas sp. OK607]